MYIWLSFRLCSFVDNEFIVHFFNFCYYVIKFDEIFHSFSYLWISTDKTDYNKVNNSKSSISYVLMLLNKIGFKDFNIKFIRNSVSGLEDLNIKFIRNSVSFAIDFFLNSEGKNFIRSFFGHFLLHENLIVE